MFPEVVGLITHGNITNPREPWVAVFTRISWGSWFSRNSLVAWMSDSVEAAGALDPCRDEERRKVKIQLLLVFLLRVWRGSTELKS